MANYLERVAASASRRAAVAKPPNSGPPVLPAGRDFSLAVEEPFASDQDQFFEPLETQATARVEQHAEIPPTPKVEVAEQPQTTARNATAAPPMEPEPKPRPSNQRSSTDSPFTVSVPRTLRPISAANVPNEPPRERSRLRTSTTFAPQEFEPREEPTPIVPSASADVEQVTDEAAPPNPPLADRTEEHQAPTPRPEAAVSDTSPAPRVEVRLDGPVKHAEPAAPSALSVHLPSAGGATKQEQSRISIGSLEVLVNNHPKVTSAPPAPAPSRSERLNLEKRYLDRFRLRH
jgi:hypothetical protein